MNSWVGVWDVEQKAIVGTFRMEMEVAQDGDSYRVEFRSEKVNAAVRDATVDGDDLRIEVDLTKPLRAKAVMELALTGPDSFEGVGKIKLLPNSTYRGVRRA